MKTRLENTIEPLGQDPEKDKFETSRWEPTQQKTLLPVDRAINRQRSDFRPLGKGVDRPVDRDSQPESENSMSVDRTQQRAMLLQTVGRPVDRSAIGQQLDRLIEQFALPTVDRPVNRKRAKILIWIFFSKPIFFQWNFLWYINTK